MLAASRQRMDSSTASSGSSSSSTLMRRRRAAGGLVAPLRVDLSACKYELLRLVAARLGWHVVEPGATDWDLYWTDTSICQERLLRLGPTQRINHFHGMLELCRKRSMARALSALAAAVPSGTSYNFFPPTWQLPGQLGDFLAAAKAGGRKATFIVKPDAGCQGKGIRLVQGGPEAAVLRGLSGLTTLQAVAQAYIARPLLINGLKFDLRVYVLVTDVDPLRVFIFKEGLVRFCTAPYKKPTSKNIGCTFMHLTNYAVNKHNTEAFVAPGSSSTAGACDTAGHVVAGSSDEEDDQQEGRSTATGGQAQGHGAAADAASKWSFRQLRQYLESQGHSWTALWSNIGKLVVKSLIAVTPHLAATYRSTVVSGAPAATTPPSCSSPRTNSSSSSSSGSSSASSAAVAAAGCRCFEVLGYDVLLDQECQPWLVEVNHSPSFGIDTPLDRAIKEQLVMDAVRLVRIEPSAIAAAKKAARRATQVRLMAPPPPRGSSSNSSSGDVAGAGVGCAVDARAAQQAHRAAVIAARDKWQDKHLGGFERLYPVPIPAQQQAATANSSSTMSPARLAELTQQQEAYHQLLAVSQQVYQRQQQQGQGQPSPLKARAGAGSSPTCHTKRNVTNSPCSNSTRQLGGQQHQQQCNMKSAAPNSCPQGTGVQPPLAEPPCQEPPADAGSSSDDDSSMQPCCADTRQPIVNVESALAVLSAVLALDSQGRQQHSTRPQSASAAQRPSSSNSNNSSSSTRDGQQSGSRPRPASVCSSRSRRQPDSVLQEQLLTPFGDRHAASSVFTRCFSYNGGSHSMAQPSQQLGAAKPRPSSAPRLCGRSSNSFSSDPGTSSNHRISSQRPESSTSRSMVRPWSSGGSSMCKGSNTKSSCCQAAAEPSSCGSRPLVASLHRSGTAAAEGQNGSRSSSSCGRSRSRWPLEAAVDSSDSRHSPCGWSRRCSKATEPNTANSMSGHNEPCHQLQEHAPTGGTAPQCSAYTAADGMSLIAAAVQEATAALDAAVAAATAAGPRCTSLGESGQALRIQPSVAAGTRPEPVGQKRTSSLNVVSTARGGGVNTSLFPSHPVVEAQAATTSASGGSSLVMQLQQHAIISSLSTGSHRDMTRFYSFPNNARSSNTSREDRAARHAMNAQQGSSRFLQHLASAGSNGALRPGASSTKGTPATTSCVDQQHQQTAGFVLQPGWSSGLVTISSCQPAGGQSTSRRTESQQQQGQHHVQVQSIGPTILVNGVAAGTGLGGEQSMARQRPLLWSSSTGGLMGRLKLADA